MDHFEEQLTQACEQARVDYLELLHFLSKYPNVPVCRIHDCLMFATEEDARLYLQETRSDG